MKEYARHHVEEASFYGKLDLVLKVKNGGGVGDGKGVLQINFIGFLLSILSCLLFHPDNCAESASTLITLFSSYLTPLLSLIYFLSCSDPFHCDQ
jgi:hypothetical protein